MGLRAAMVIAALAGLAAASCFDPKIVSGHLECASSGKACPDGFTCAGGLCVTAKASGDGTGGSGGAGGHGGTGGATCAAPIQPLCQPNGGGSDCDPVCQTGCTCGLRCDISSSGSGPGVVCAAPAGTKSVAEVCNLDLDDCAPGLVCQREVCGDNLGRCYRLCRDASACGAGVACSAPLNVSGANGLRVCDLGNQTCDPFAQTDCPTGLTCYVTGPSQTSCECPSMPGMERQEGDSCSASSDCDAGLWCLNVSGSPRCLRLCQSAADCANCTTVGTYKYCPP